MGHMLDYHCTNCGFSSSARKEESALFTSLLVGFGRSDDELLKEKYPDADDELIFRVSGRQPHYCTNCQMLFVNELGEDPVVCPECKSEAHLHSYFSPEARGETQGATEENDENALTQGKFYCPKCKSMSLTFSASGLWD
ncbi:MAG: hypothetical protein ACQEQU_02895 [Spirochaetota bacterium]